MRVRLVWVLRLLVLGLVVTVVLAGLERVERANEDTDADGIPDCTERAGLASANGRELGATDHELADTDGDGVADGDEVVMSPPSTWLEERLDRSWSCPSEIRSALSDPARADTDGDLLVDAYEISAGSSAFVGDTDGDGLSDGRERGWGSDPNDVDTDEDGIRDVEDVAYGMTPVFREDRISPDTWADEFRQGLVNGDVADEVDSIPQLLGSMSGGAASSIPIIGWFAGGAADARDVTANAIRGEWISAASSAAGLVPVVGDTVRASGLLTKFLLKYPDKVNQVARAVAGLEQVPVAVRIKFLGVADSSGMEQVRRQGLTDEQIIKLATRGTSPAAMAKGVALAAGKRAIEAPYADPDGFVQTFAGAQRALRARAQAVDGADQVFDGPVYIAEIPGARERGGRLVDACTRCMPRPRPGVSTLRVVKLGTQLHTDTLQREIDKDAYLVKRGFDVEWHFYASRTGLVLDPPLLAALDDAGVSFYLHLPG